MAKERRSVLGLVATAGVVAAVLGVIVYFVVAALAMAEETEQTELRMTNEGSVAASEAREQQKGALAEGPAWVNRDEGVVQIPIERAKRLVLRDLKRDPTTATPPPKKKDQPRSDAGEAPEAGSGGRKGDLRGKKAPAPPEPAASEPGAP